MFVDTLSVVVLPTYLAAIVVFIYVFLVQGVRRQAERKKKFVKSILEGLKIGSINTLEDVVNIYKGVSGSSSENLEYQYRLSRRLREILVDLNTRNVSVIGYSIEDEVIKDWAQKISNFINENETTSPYADLPDAERNILSDISSFLDQDDVDSVKRKILELAGMIQARNDDLKKIKSINNWTVPLTIIGFILSTIFAIKAW